MGGYVWKRAREEEGRIVDVVEKLSLTRVVVIAILWDVFDVNKTSWEDSAGTTVPEQQLIVLFA